MRGVRTAVYMTGRVVLMQRHGDTSARGFANIERKKKKGGLEAALCFSSRTI